MQTALLTSVSEPGNANSGRDRVAVIIATRNRRVELERTCRVLSALDPAPDEILVCADGCTDATPTMLREQFPQVRVFVNEFGRGSIPARDFLIRQASSEIILSLDDDSHPIENDFIARLKELMTRHPEAAVLTFPQRSDEYPETVACPPSAWGHERCVGAYASSGAALRRSAYLASPGYAVFFGHVYEEPDYALQCCAAGWAVMFTPQLTVRHYFTNTNRDEVRNHARQARNEQWSLWMRCPVPYLPVVAVYRLVRQFQYAWMRGLHWVWREPAWWLATVRGLPHCWRNRRPIPWSVYWQWMKLGRRPLSKSGWLAAFASPHLHAPSAQPSNPDV